MTSSSPVSRLIRRNVAAVGAAYAIGGLAGFGAQAYIARRLGTAVFGRYVAALALVGIIAMVDEIGGNGYLVREAARAPERLGALLADVLALKVATGIAAILVTFIASIVLGFGAQGITIAVLLAFMFAANATARALRAGLQVIERMDIGARLSIANSVVSAVGMVVVLAAGGTIIEAIAFSTGVSVALIPITWLRLRPHVRVTLGVSAQASFAVARESLPFAAIGLLAFGVTFADTLIVRGALGERATGLYGSAYRLITVFAFLPAAYLDSVYRWTSHAAEHRREEFAHFVDRSAAWLLIVAMPIAAGGMIFGRRILAIVFGAPFTPASHAFEILLWSMVFSFPAWMLTTALLVGDRPRSAGRLYAVAFAVNIGANLLLVPRFGYIAAAWTMLATEFAIVVGASFALHARGIPMRWHRAFPGALAASAVMVAAVFPARHHPIPIPVAIGAFAYVAALCLLRVPWRLGLVPPVAVVARPAPESDATAPVVSVVMPVYNVALFVEDAVRAVLAQTFTDFELIVVDDGSTDTTAEIVARIDDARIRLVREPHRGYVAAQNTGFDRARGRYICRPDGDDLTLPELLARQVAVLDARPDVVAVGVLTRSFGGKQRVDAPISPAKILRRLRRGTPVTQPVMFRTDAARAAGGLRDVRWEDWDLWIRLIWYGSIVVIPEVLALIRVRAGSVYWGTPRLERFRARLQMQLFAARSLGPTIGGVASMMVMVAKIATWKVTRHPLASQPVPVPAAPDTHPRVSVIVTTYHRPESLARCLAGIEAQGERAAEIVVAHRPDDTATAQFLEEWRARDPERHRPVPSFAPGIIPALLAGTRAARGDVLAFLDDDAVPRAGWLGEIARAFCDPTVGAFGGPFVDHIEGVEVPVEPARTIGRITWYGRAIGNHGRGAPGYRDVEFLAGTNMAYRRGLAIHDHRLMHASTGLSLASELDTALTVRRYGYRILFSAWAVVDHYTTSFRDPVLGSRVVGEDIVGSSANYTYALLKYLSPARRAAFLVYAYAIGSAMLPGPVRAAGEFLRSPARASAMSGRVGLVWRGRAEGIRMYGRFRRGASGSTGAPRIVRERVHT